jgi:gas vesicle protein
MTDTEGRKTLPMAGSVAGTIFGAVLAIGAVALSNKEVRSKMFKLLSQGLDKLADGSVKDTFTKTADTVGTTTRKTMERVKDTVGKLTDDVKEVKRVAAR